MSTKSWYTNIKTKEKSRIQIFILVYLSTVSTHEASRILLFVREISPRFVLFLNCYDNYDESLTFQFLFDLVILKQSYDYDI